METTALDWADLLQSLHVAPAAADLFHDAGGESGARMEQVRRIRPLLAVGATGHHSFFSAFFPVD